MADGKPLDPAAFTAAHPSLPFGTRVRVTDLSSGRSVVVRITDRGPVGRARIIDVSAAAAKALGMRRDGVAEVRVGVLAASTAPDPSSTACPLPRIARS